MSIMNSKLLRKLLKEYWFILVFPIVSVSMIYVAYIREMAIANDFAAAKSTLRNALKARDVTIIEGAIIESPSIILEFDNPGNFIKKVMELNAKTVYVEKPTEARSYSEEYYLFTENFGMAFRFTLKQSTWGELL